MTNPDVLIIGGGLAGLTAAHFLLEKGWNSIVLDKGRGPGGRMSTRHAGEARFDHGAQFFSTKTTDFQIFIKKAEIAGVVKKWTPAHLEDAHPRWVGSQGMNSLPKFLTQNLNVFTGQKAIRLAPQSNGWKVFTESGHEFSAGALIVTIPSPQALDLLKNSGLELPETFDALQQIEYLPCLAVLARTDKPRFLPSPGSLAPDNQAIIWIADNFQKGISPVPAITIHASPAFSQEHLEGDLQATGTKLLELATPYLGDVQVLDFQIHRWRYSLPYKRFPGPFFKTETDDFPLLFGGDGFGQGNVEGAFLSGLEMSRFFSKKS